MNSRNRATVMLTLVITGEAIFMLPFVIARVFRPTLLDAFGLTNLQLGTAFSAYGMVAMVGYVAGGPLADTFGARKLMTAALIGTAVGGLAFATMPSPGELQALFAFWGLTTILLLWAALIRATRQWGGPDGQGRAFGILDGGRGLVAAAFASIAVAIFAALLPADVESASLAQRSAALQQIIVICTAFTFAVALLVWVAMPKRHTVTPDEGHQPSEQRFTMSGLKRVAAMPEVWLQALIVLCAYVGYKSTDDFGLYARDAFGYNDVASAQLGTVSFWVRPVAALGLGLVSDRIHPSRAVVFGFLGLIVCTSALALGAVQPGMPTVLVITVATTSACIYGLRGVYFALLGETKIPLAYTGSAVGLISLVGYTPDVFMGPWMGYLTDNWPGALGHHYLFATVAGFGVVGLGAALVLRWRLGTHLPR